MATFNNFFVRNQVAPELPYTYVLCEIPVQGISFALGALENRANETTWIDKNNWKTGRHLIREIQVGLLMGSSAEALNRLYRLLDNIYNGQEYTVVSETPLIIEPEIPLVPNPVSSEGGIRYMLDNLPGIINPGWFGVGGQKATLADIVRGLSTGKESVQTDLWDTIQDLFDAGGDTASMADAVGELVTGTAETVTSGGILVALLASIVTNTVMGRAQTVMLERILRALNGGNMLFPPSDNILQALRGDTAASAERNVIDSFDNQGTIDKLDELLTELQQNTTDNAAIIAKLESIREELV